MINEFEPRSGVLDVIPPPHCWMTKQVIISLEHFQWNSYLSNEHLGQTFGKM